MSLAQRQARLAVRRIMSLRFESSTTGSGHVRKPMINFNSKSKSHDDKPGQPHPMAPKDVVQDFASFGKRSPPKTQRQSSQSSSSSSSSSSQQQQLKSSPPTKGLPAADFEEFFEMPKRYWTRPPMEDAEIEAIMSGGATNVL